MSTDGVAKPGLLDAMLALQGEVPKLHKDATNPAFRSKYVTLDSVMDTVGPLLFKHQLVWTTLPISNEHGEPALYYRLAHTPTGEQIAGTMPLLLPKQDPQGLGSALTYSRRQSLCAVLNLVADDDDDGNGASSAVTGKRSTGGASDKSLALLKSLVTKEKPSPAILKVMLAGVGASDVDPSKQGWSGKLNQAQVSGLIDVFKTGALPTGESDIPSDIEPPVEAEPGDDVPFDVQEAPGA